MCYIIKTFKDKVTPETRRHGTEINTEKTSVKWEFKLWCRADMFGYIYGIEVCLEPSSKGPPKKFQNENKYGKGEYLNFSTVNTYCLNFNLKMTYINILKMWNCLLIEPQKLLL